MLPSLLIANRGTCAARVARTAKALGVRSIAIFVDDDDGHAAAADAAVAVPSYTDGDAIIKAALAEGAAAIHPGYGFLSENTDFAKAVVAAGLVWVGPTPESMAAFATKHAARELATAAGVPTVPGSDGLVADAEAAAAAAASIGYPVLLKSTAGGGGQGQAVVETPADIEAAFAAVARQAGTLFGDSGILVEAYVAAARHVEIQIFGLGNGRVVALGDRDCSAQRRNQKVIEEAPAPGLTSETRTAMSTAAIALCERVGYVNAGTVEFLVDVGRAADGAAPPFYFLEVNTRLQVEHAVTEQVTGLDLVAAQLAVASGLPVADVEAAAAKIAAGGITASHSIQARIYAEDPARGFTPSPGLLSNVAWPPAADWLRLETTVTAPGARVSPLYDPMIAKIIVTAPTREEALARLAEALAATALDGVETNVPFLAAIVKGSDALREGRLLTRDVPAFPFVSSTVAVTAVSAGAAIIVDAGRPDLWKAGVPPSGAADNLAFGAANRLVGNDADDAAAIELLMEGVTLTFAVAARVAVTGATPAPLLLDGAPVAPWTAIDVPAGGVLTVGKLAGPGSRAYVAVAGGGFDVPKYLGSRTTFSLGAFGGHAGRALKAGDVLRLFDGAAPTTPPPPPPPGKAPTYSHTWSVGALEGPHTVGFMQDAEFLYGTPLKVHYNSNRLGVRLEGADPPTWLRADGGDAGLHPSNVLDTVYSHNAVNITGELPVFLGVDGPSLGGFVCPVVVARADAWKLGQARPGDTITFRRVARGDALAAAARLKAGALDVEAAPSAPGHREDPVLLKRDGAGDAVGGRVVVRLAGEDALLVEFGSDETIDLKLRLAVRALTDDLPARLGGAGANLRELSPGVRSLHIQFDPAALPLADLLGAVSAAVTSMPVPRRVPSRILHLPLAFDASTTRAALARYAQGVRAKAPYLPSNIDFVARINGTQPDDVRDIVHAASYLVLGLGDVYLGAPCALPVDPRHRLTTTKMNPARVWTAEGEVGLGGSFMCVYGMDSPGGYQLVGRTVQMWSTHARGRNPWLLNEFDQVRFYPVLEPELNEIRAKYARGATALRIEDTVFDLDEYEALLASNDAEITADRDRKRAAFVAEREAWAAAADDDACGDADDDAADGPGTPDAADAWPDDAVVVTAPVAGRFVPAAHVGGAAAPGGRLGTMEAMKMELALDAPDDGASGWRVLRLLARAGGIVDQGDGLLLLAPETEGGGAAVDAAPVDAAPVDAAPVGAAPVDAAPQKKASPLDLTRVSALRASYAVGGTTVAAALTEAHRRAAAAPAGVFYYIAPLPTLLARAAALDAVPVDARGHLHGVPIAVKDNIDVAGMPTTAGCPAARGTAPAPTSAAAVARLEAAGAVVIGKTGMDQWAAGLTGQRSPTGPIGCAVDETYISGGSSSGSGVAVALGIVPAALGTDTAGSGRVPAALNGIVGYKPTRGLLSTAGVVPACASLDCVTVFAATCADAREVARVAAGPDEADSWSRKPPSGAPAAAWGVEAGFTYGVLPPGAAVDDASVTAALARAASAADALGGTRVVLGDAEAKALLDAARLLYAQGSPWVAERVCALEAELKQAGADWSTLHPVTRAVLEPGRDTRAADAWTHFHALRAARALVDGRVWPNIDVLLLPTVPRTFSLEEVAADPLTTNAALGTYTNCANLLDLAAVALPAGVDEARGLPVGVQLVGPAWSDDSLLELGARLHAATAPDAPLTVGSTTRAGDVDAGLDAAGRVLSVDGPTVDLFVVGAHLAGLPLNPQLTARGGRLARAAATAAAYSLHVLDGGAKPGLVKRGEAEARGSVRGEVWTLPLAGFATFVAECVPAPLSIGTVDLDDGTHVKGFLCEAAAAAGADDITALGGWREFVKTKAGA